MSDPAEDGGFGPAASPHPSDKKQACDEAIFWGQVDAFVNSHSENTIRTIHNVNQRLWNAVNSPLELNYDNIHVDYFPLRQKLVLRMPGTLHEVFIDRLAGIITEQLGQITRESGPAAEVARGVRNLRSTRIKPNNPAYGEHDPDTVFGHAIARRPTVVIEVTHSQRAKDFIEISEDYILGSSVRIRIVVGFDLEYRKNKMATFSVWRAKGEGPENARVWSVETAVKEQVFRNKDGSPNIDDTFGLTLPLHDFAGQNMGEPVTDLGRDIFVSCKELYDCLEEAEVWEENFEEYDLQPAPSLITRRVERSPERIDEHDEEA